VVSEMVNFGGHEVKGHNSQNRKLGLAKTIESDCRRLEL